MVMRKNIGFTLIELMVALVISSILIAALYRAFIGQQKTYTVQEQVVDTQQNLRVAMIKMMREIRMVGFGNIVEFLNRNGPVNGSGAVIDNKADEITIVGAFRQAMHDTGEPITIVSHSNNQITLNYATDMFDLPAHKFICIGGIESNEVMVRATDTLTLKYPLIFDHKQGTPIFKIQSITYSLGISGTKPVLQRNENTGGGAQPVADNIESLQFKYYDGQNPAQETAISKDIRMIRVTVTGRTDVSDPEYTGKPGGYRRRTITSNIYTRNMGITP